MSSDRGREVALGHGPRTSLTAVPVVRGLPDRQAMRRWLLSEAVDAGGAVTSWSNPHHPGYPYAEAAGLFLSIVCTAPGLDRDAAAAAKRVAAWLGQTIGDNGGVGRGQVTYVFDSAVALAGLLRYRAASGDVGCDQAIHRLRAFICDAITAGISVLPRQAAGDGRWSTQFGAHLLKCLHGLYLHAETFGEPLSGDIVSMLIDRSGRQPSPVYVHPFCYEQEGHAVIALYGPSSLFEPIDGALDWLATLQQPDGSILAFANGIEGFGEPRSDATAQAVRLWLLRDRAHYGHAIDRALAFLAACQSPDGGIRYSPGRDDVCSWSTMFTMQAVEWFLDRPCVAAML